MKGLLVTRSAGLAVELCNSVFAPSPDAVSWAHRVRAIFEEPGNASKGALSLDGVMIERLHLAQAERILALDAAIRAMTARMALKEPS